MCYTNCWGLSLQDGFCVPTGEEKYMERNLNCELINAKNSDSIKCAQGTSAQGHLIFNSYLVTRFENVWVGLTKYD